nr:tryptophan synthase alpha chain (TRPA) [Polytomella parva]
MQLSSKSLSSFCASKKQPRVTCKAAAIAQKSLSGTMASLKKRGKVAFIPFLCAGDPDLETTALAVERLDKIGADVIELGVPYSDPLADGHVIQNAATRSLEKGTTLDKVIDMVKQISPKVKAPIVLFTYFNPILKKGVDNYAKILKDAGVSGLLVPDIPLEETDIVREACSKQGVELILLTTPTTPISRMKEITAKSQGFVYLVSVTGVTGARTSVEGRVKDLVQSLKSVSNKPICVGFGVSKPEHADEIVRMGAEGVICGSALVRVLGETQDKAKGLEEMEALAKSLRAVIP